MVDMTGGGGSQRFMSTGSVEKVVIKSRNELSKRRNIKIIKNVSIDTINGGGGSYWKRRQQ